MNRIFRKSFILTIVLAFFLSPLSFNYEKNVEPLNHSFNIEVKNVEAAEPQSVDASGFLDCSTWDFACKGINFLQIIFVTGGNIIVGLAAFFMDTFLFHSLQSSSYRDSGFIEQGWEILRNLTNIVFIFALLSLAFKMVLDVGQANAKKLLVRVIIIALTINFSLFFSYAVIDMSNILAYTFYNKIDRPEVTFDASSDGGGGSDSIESEQEFKGESTSLAIAAKINPQRLLSADVVSNPTKGQRVVMVIMAGVINGTLIYVFLSVAFLFLGRTIALWLTVILAPLAFASLTIPGWEKKKYFGFDNWLKSLIETSFMAPVFLFFLYLAVQFMKIDINSTAGAGSGAFINNILNIIIPMAAIVLLLITAKKVSNSMSGDFAGTISGMVAKVAGGAVAVGAIAATGGAAALGGAARGVGMIAGGQNSRTGRILQGAGQRLQATNFNFGQSRIGQAVSRRTGVNMGANLGNLSYARADTATRRSANTVRAGIDNLRTGRTPESIQNWQDNVQDSRDTLTQTRIANRQRQRAEDETLGVANIRGYVSDGTPINNNTELLANLQSRLARRTSDEARVERDQLDEQRNDIQLDIDALQDTINNLARNNQNGQNTNQIRDLRGELTDLRRDQRRVDETSLTGQIEQVERVISDEANTARAEMLTDDRDNRRATQNASMTMPFANTSRRERMDTQASRVGGNQIQTDGGRVGGDANQGNRNT